MKSVGSNGIGSERTWTEFGAILKILCVVLTMDILVVAFVGWTSGASLLIFLFILTIVTSTSAVSILVTIYLWRRLTNVNWEEQLLPN